MIYLQSRYDLATKSWVTGKTFLSSTSKLKSKGYKLTSYEWQWPYAYGSTVAPTCLAKWVD